jgi:hypothetical protein
MLVELKPRIEALLKAQVAAGHYDSIEDALTAAVLGASPSDEKLGELGWARWRLEEADAAIAEGRTFSEAEAFAELESRFNKL